MDKLTVKQNLFADYFIESGKKAESYKRAGYAYANDNVASVEASKLLKNPKVKAYIDERLESKSEERIATQDEVLEFYTKAMRGEIKEQFGLDAALKERLEAGKQIAKRYGLDKAVETKLENDNSLKFDITGNVIDNTVKPFENSFFDIYNNRYTHYWFKGGRGSTKSSFISLIIPYLIERNEKFNVVILRKVGNTLKKSVYNQVLWALDKLEIRDRYKTTTSPLEMTKIDTGQKIVFLGCDDPTKIKSLKFENGYPAIVWYEEVDQFSGMEEIRNLNQSLLRGGDVFWAFYSFNPPKSKNNWANEEVLVEKENRKVYHSTYLDVPKEWLGELFFIEAQDLKNKKENSYRHEYLGEAVGNGGSVFDNVTIREITEEEIKSFDKIYYGCDFGFSVDPAACGKYHVHNNKLYILDEIYEIKLSNKNLAEKIKAKGVGKEVITFDSSEPKSIDEIRQYGITALGAKKGPDSVNYGMKYLQDLDEIIIDKRRTPNAAKEFIGYEYEMNKEGQFISRYPDKNNHFIDATRYALEWFVQQNRSRIDSAR